MQRAHLPLPSAEELAHSQRLGAVIRAEIAGKGGAIEFARFMELALYAPGLGYYSAGLPKFGTAGDFITAPELGNLFARCLARALAPVLASCAPADVFELGGGSGALAVDLMQELARLDALPARYRMLEPSAELRQRQQERVRQLPTELATRFEWLDGPPQASWRGALIANEVIDALPAYRFSKCAGEVYAEWVTLGDDGELLRLDRPADGWLGGAVRHLERSIGHELGDGYRSEILPQLPAWFSAVAGLLETGLVLFADYGYPRREYYRPERDDGTLICHYRHRAHADAYFLPGLQDLTTFVDFTALAEAGVAAGFDLAGYTTQARFLLAHGLPEIVAASQDLPELERYRLSGEAKRLTLPDAMGERFKFMGFARDCPAAVALFDPCDQSRLL